MPPGQPGPWAATSSCLGVDADRPHAIGYSAGIARCVKKNPHFPEIERTAEILGL